MTDDAPTYTITGTNVWDVIEDRLEELVEIQAWLSGESQQGLWKFIEAHAHGKV